MRSVHYRTQIDPVTGAAQSGLGFTGLGFAGRRKSQANHAARTRGPALCRAYCSQPMSAPGRSHAIANDRFIIELQVGRATAADIGRHAVRNDAGWASPGT